MEFDTDYRTTMKAGKGMVIVASAIRIFKMKGGVVRLNARYYTKINLTVVSVQCVSRLLLILLMRGQFGITFNIIPKKSLKFMKIVIRKFIVVQRNMPTCYHHKMK